MHVKKTKQHWKQNDILYKANFVWNTIDCIRVISWTSINNVKICYFIRVFMSFYLSVLRKERSPSKLVHHSFKKILQFKFLHCFLSFWYHTNRIVYCLAKCLFASSQGYGGGGEEASFQNISKTHLAVSVWFKLPPLPSHSPTMFLMLWIGSHDGAEISTPQN